MLGRVHWMDKDAFAVRFIMLCQDSDDGGIADKPGNQPDVYHTFFGVAGLSLLGWREIVSGPDNGQGAGATATATMTERALPPIDPTFAMPPATLDGLKIEKQDSGK